MKKIYFLLIVSFTIITTFAVPFTPGNLVVVRIGTGVGGLGTEATAVFLDEYTPLGVLVQSIPMPIADAGSNQILTLGGTPVSEGALTLSPDKNFLSLGGYDAATGTANVSGTASATIKRVVGIIDILGNINTTTALTDAFSGNNIRGAVISGTNIWMTGGIQGVRYTTQGSSTSTALFANPASTRVIKIINNQLYCTSASAGFIGVNAIGSGTPTTAASATLLPGFNTITRSPYGFDIQPGSGDIIYVADDNGVGNGGIQKWVRSGGTYSLAYTINSLSTGARSISVDWTTLPTPVIYTTSATGNSIYRTMDNGSAASSTQTLLVSIAGSNTVFRGLAFTPGSFVVPLDISSFKASKNNSGNLITWTTANEVNVKNIILERSADGKNFSELKQINAGSANYQYLDASPLNGINYYRLRINDLNGSFKTSSVVTVSNTGDTIITGIYPTITTGRVSINISRGTAGLMQFVFTDVQGRQTIIKSINTGNATSTVTLDASALTPGMYFVKVLNNNNSTSFKIIKN
ncbi:MAG: T9SS type A sorting domain-containing protein [Ferruginibacter sp.]